MSPMLIIAKREFRSYFDSPLAYVVICLSFLALGIVFFLVPPSFWQQDRATVQTMFEKVPYGLCFLIVPVVTMRLLAEEKRSGTLEMLITLPVKDSDVILGKYLGAMGLMLILLAASLVFPVAMFSWPWNLGPLDWHTVWSGYLGLFLLSAATVAIGLLISALCESQAVAFFITVFVLGILALLGDISNFLPSNWAFVALNYIGFGKHIENFARGLVDTRDIVFFVTVTGLALVVAFRALERRKWA